MPSSVSGPCTEVRDTAAQHTCTQLCANLCTHVRECSCVDFLVFHRRTTAPAVHQSGAEQGDHLYLSGAPYAHLPLTAHHPTATEESPGTSGKDNAADEVCSGHGREGSYHLKIHVKKHALRQHYIWIQHKNGGQFLYMNIPT